MLALLIAAALNGWNYDIIAGRNGVQINLTSPSGKQYTAPSGRNCKLRFAEEDEAGEWIEKWIKAKKKDWTCVQKKQ
jgi:hypothetical protein